MSKMNFSKYLYRPAQSELHKVTQLLYAFRIESTKRSLESIFAKSLS